MPSPVDQNLIQDALTDRLVFPQLNFSGGMNQQVDPTRLQNNEYPLAVNIRTRYGVAELVKLPLDADPQGTLSGLLVQGIYSAGPYFIVFANGKAFYKNAANQASAFTQIASFQLSPTAEHIYAEQVPASSMNFGRQLEEADNIRGGVKLFGSVNGSPQCLVCQDGENQPWLIFEDGTARRAGGYVDWAIDNREYVPIGHMMMYLNGVLYIVGDVSTGSLVATRRQIFRSVTGRPLDFVVNIDINGNKGGDASTTSFAVDYDAITCISRLNSNDGGFFVSTAKNSYLVLPQFTPPLPFNEPTFITQALFNTGPLNNFSLCDISGDAAFVDFGGIRSFNAVLQNRNEGKNLPFSKKIAALFETIVQTVTAAISYDDYAFFAVETIYGRGILVFDTIQDIWVGIDFFTDEDLIPLDVSIQQFCEVKIGSTRKLFCRTSDNLVYEMFAGTDYATGNIFTGEWCSNDAAIEVKPLNLKLVYTDVEEEGNVTITPYVDRKAQTALTLPLTQNATVFATPLGLPFGPSDSDVVRNINFGLDNNVAQGWKIGFWISWNFAAQLTHIRCECIKIKATESTDEQAGSLYNS